jgi:excisionase family DNA binding protein
MVKKQGQSPVYLTQTRAAEILGVHVETVRRWCRANKLASVRFGDGVIRIPLWAVFPPEAVQAAAKPAAVVKLEAPVDVAGQELFEFQQCG